MRCLLVQSGVRTGMGGLRPRRWRRTAPSVLVLYEGPECVGLERAALRLSFRAARPEARIGRVRRPRGRPRWRRPSPPRGPRRRRPRGAGGPFRGACRPGMLAQRSPPAAGALLLAYPFAPPKRAARRPAHPSGALPCGFVSGERDSHAPPGTPEAVLRIARTPSFGGPRVHGWSRARPEPGGLSGRRLRVFCAPGLERHSLLKAFSRSSMSGPRPDSSPAPTGALRRLGAPEPRSRETCRPEG